MRAQGQSPLLIRRKDNHTQGFVLHILQEEKNRYSSLKMDFCADIIQNKG